MYWKLHLWHLLIFPFFIVMLSFNIGSLNINRCRDVRKRATLFKYLQLKKADVILLQETHTPVMRQIG